MLSSVALSAAHVRMSLTLPALPSKHRVGFRSTNRTRAETRPAARRSVPLRCRRLSAEPCNRPNNRGRCISRRNPTPPKGIKFISRRTGRRPTSHNTLLRPAASRGRHPLTSRSNPRPEAQRRCKPNRESSCTTKSTAAAPASRSADVAVESRKDDPDRSREAILSIGFFCMLDEAASPQRSRR